MTRPDRRSKVRAGGEATIRHGHHSKVRAIWFEFWPYPETSYFDEVRKTLEKALRDGVIHQWWTSRTGQSWFFGGRPGADLRALRDRVVVLLGGPLVARRKLPACGHCDGCTDALCLAMLNKKDRDAFRDRAVREMIVADREARRARQSGSLP